MSVKHPRVFYVVLINIYWKEITSITVSLGSRGLSL